MSQLIIYSIYAALYLRNFFFMEQMISIYNTQPFIPFFSVFCKCLINRVSFFDRSVFRNVVFDLSRNLPAFIIEPYIFNKPQDPYKLIQLMTFSIILSCYFTLKFDKESFVKNHPMIYVWLNAEFIILFTNALIKLFNSLERLSEGNVVVAAIMVWF